MATDAGSPQPKHLELNDMVATKGGWMGQLGRALSSFMTPRSQKESQAALMIQCFLRVYLAKRRVHYLRTMRRLVALMARRERKYAILIQTRWRMRQQAKLELEATKIQAVVKGRVERKQLDHQMSILTFTENRAAKVIQKHSSIKVEKMRMMNQCRGVLEKQGRKYGFGKWEMVVWQERYVKLTADGLVYQHVKSNSEPSGAEKPVPYASMKTVKALLGDVLYLQCTKRDYFFQLQSAADCETWATNIVQLAQCAGFDVPGYVVMPPDAVSGGNDAPEGVAIEPQPVAADDPDLKAAH